MGYWRQYVSVAARKAQATKHLKAAQKEGKVLNPVVIKGRQIARTFWGRAWCDNLENYSDYANRLPRGRTYVRNGSVIDLQVSKGNIHAQVMGSYLYEVDITIKEMGPLKWQSLVKACSGKIDSLVELLQGKFSNAVMAMIIDPNNGLFPRPNEISMECSCPDGVGMCKHTAAVLYGIGARLDLQPEWLFKLRHVDHLQLIVQASADGIIALSKPSADVLEESDLSSLFGIEIVETLSSVKEMVPSTPKQSSPAPVAKDIELSVPQAAALMKISESHLRSLLDGKVIAFRKKGKQRWIAFEEIIKYRKNLKKA